MLQLNKKIIIKKRDSIYFGLNMETGSTYEMNEVQFYIINFFDGVPNTKDKLLENIRKKFDGDFVTIRKEVDYSIDNLISRNILLEI